MPRDAKPIMIAIERRPRVSGLLLAPPRARACYVLAHGAGAGMTHPFMAAVAAELGERGVATLRYQFPYMEQRRQAARPAEARARRGARRGGRGRRSCCRSFRSSPAANRSAAA